jgi:hypothetical protein
MSDSNMPKPFQGNWPKGGQGLGAGYVNPQPVRFIDEQGTFWLNPHEASARRGQARGADGQGKRGPNSDVGER